jgi:ubiquinone/menaquinone biosynthesis C-methylase UbiE
MMSTNEHTALTPDRIMELAWGYVPPLVIEAAIHSRIFDLLDVGPKTIEEIQEGNGASLRGLSAVVNALAGLGLLAKDHAGRFSLTPESSAFLVSTKPEFQGGLLSRCSQYVLPRWLRLNETIVSSKPVNAVNQQAPGTVFFRGLVSDLFPRNYPTAKALAQHLLESRIARDGDTALDLAAGSGVWGIVLAQSSPSIHVTAVDWPEVLPITRETAARFGVSNRFTFIEGDLRHVDFGRGYRIATLGHILHSEGALRSRALIEKTYQALLPGGTIAIAEVLVNADRIGPLNGLFFAINMLLNTDEGDTYSFEEISSWLSDAGFVDVRMLDAPGPSPLILATKPQ